MAALNNGFYIWQPFLKLISCLNVEIKVGGAKSLFSRREYWNTKKNRYFFISLQMIFFFKKKKKMCCLLKLSTGS